MEKNIKFDDIEIQKQNFTKIKGLFQLKMQILIKQQYLNKISFGEEGFQFFNCCKDAKKFRTLCIYLPKMSAYRKVFEETKYISFLTKDGKLLEKCN